MYAIYYDFDQISQISQENIFKEIVKQKLKILKIKIKMRKAYFNLKINIFIIYNKYNKKVLKLL